MEPAFRQFKENLQKRDFQIIDRVTIEHQEKMAIVAGKYANGRWVGAWAKWIKDSNISLYQLDKLVLTAESLERQGKADACGFVRNRLQKKDWHKWGIWVLQRSDKSESKKSLKICWDGVSYWFCGGQGQNRTADTGIFRASKIDKALIMLEQGRFGTTSGNCVDSTGWRWLAQVVKTGQCTVSVRGP